MKRIGIAAACAFVGAVFYLLWLVFSFERVNQIEHLTPPVETQHVDAVKETQREPLRAAPAIEQSPTSVRTETPTAKLEPVIQGVALLPIRPCAAGFAFAWEDGPLPTGDEFRAAARGNAHGSVKATPIHSNGGFRFDGLAPGKSYTLSAVTQGAVCVERQSGLHLGVTNVELHLLFTYGVAIRLEDARGGAVRTTDKLFGGTPSFQTSARQAPDGSPELDALSIEGLEPRGWNRDRWQYLAVAESDGTALGPIDYGVEVPGYLPRKEMIQAPRLIEKLAETTIKLEAKATSWDKVSVRLVGLPRMEGFGFDEARVVGTVHLIAPPKQPSEFAVHPRALVETEVISGVPAGSYLIYFEAADAYYQTKNTQVEIGPGPSVLTFDCSDSGSLLFEVQGKSTPADAHFSIELEEKRGGNFSLVCDSRPYLIPLLYPGEYKIKELSVDGRACPHPGEVLIYQGRTTSIPLVCGASADSDPPR